MLEGDFASLCALGSPLSLSIQLQQSCLRLSEAHWTARSTDIGFSVSLFWPAPKKVKKDAKKKRKRRRRGKARAQAVQATTTSPSKQCATHRTTKTSASKVQTPVLQTAYPSQN